MPAIAGVAADVPPNATILPLRYTRYPTFSADEVSDRSGTLRALSPGTPGPVCHAGLPKIVLDPPPPDAGSPGALSFHAASGIYDFAESPFAWLVSFQYALPVPVNSVPPTPVTSGIDAGRSTESSPL